jgi:hypothetical protein
MLRSIVLLFLLFLPFTSCEHLYSWSSSCEEYFHPEMKCYVYELSDTVRKKYGMSSHIIVISIHYKTLCNASLENSTVAELFVFMST